MPQEEEVESTGGNDFCVVKKRNERERKSGRGGDIQAKSVGRSSEEKEGRLRRTEEYIAKI